MEAEYKRARTALLVKIDGMLEESISTRFLQLDPRLADENGNVSSYGAELHLGHDDVIFSYRPYAHEIETLATYLIAFSSIGVLLDLRSGAVKVSEAEDLLFVPATASLIGRLPYGDSLVPSLYDLMGDLFCANPDELSADYLDAQFNGHLECVLNLVENVEANLKLDPRWALSARCARALLRLRKGQ